MLIDLAAAVLLLLALYKGLRNGAVMALFYFLAIGAGLLAAWKGSDWMTGLLEGSLSLPPRWISFIAFALLFTGAALLVRLAGRAIEGALRLAALGWLNRLGGVLFYTLLYGLLLSFVLYWGSRLGWVRKEASEGSYAWPLVQPLAPALAEVLGWRL